MGIIRAVCISGEKGTAKRNVGEAEFIENHGLKGDAHAGNWHRQVSLLSLEKINAFRAGGADVADGAFGENLVVEGIETGSLPPGTILRCGQVILEITQIGKECHNHCAIFEAMGDCIMPREGIFAKVLHGGKIKTGDEIRVDEVRADNSCTAFQYRAAVITVSDKGFRGEREDKSGPVVREIARAAGYRIEHCVILPDEQDLLEAELKRLADGGLADLILTTGGTGFSPRDRTPEATLAAADRCAPGIAEAMRACGMAVTRRAMLSRGAAVIRGKTLIINLPGSPKAARENLECVIDELRHGLDILTGRDGECG
ncbi:MAG: MOSC domain-containing protein [Treponema sp.]|nr:MOSC domain-containing protein [Treponema sp.]